MSAPRIHREDPSPLLEAAFRRIQRERLEGVAILNPVLSVEAIGFSLRRQTWQGVLITPWFMNLILVPAHPASWHDGAPGERVLRSFPSGLYAFQCGRECEIGEFLSCGLVSPMGQFRDQRAARAVALASLELLERPAPGARSGDPGTHPDRCDTRCPQPMSRREWLNRVFARRTAQ